MKEDTINSVSKAQRSIENAYDAQDKGATFFKMVQDEKDGSAIDYVASKDAVPSKRYNQDSSEQEFEIE